MSPTFMFHVIFLFLAKANIWQEEGLNSHLNNFRSDFVKLQKNIQNYGCDSHISSFCFILMCISQFPPIAKWLIENN